MKKEIRTDNAPQPVGPYSQAVRAGDFLFISEMIPLKPDGTITGNDIGSQTVQVIENIKALVETAGGSLDDIVKTTVFIKDLNDFAAMNEIYARYFGSGKPARSAIEVCRIPKDVLIGMDAIAFLNK